MSRPFADRAGKILLVAGWLFSCSGAERVAPAAKPARTEARKCDGMLPPLAEPAVWLVPWPELTPEQRRKKDEVEQDKARQACKQGWRILTVTQYKNGDFIYWVDPRDMDLAEPPNTAGQYVPREMAANSAPRPWLEIWIPRYDGYILGDTKATSFDEWLKETEILSLPPSVYQGPSKPR
jgi:hypothetical protein